MSSESRSQTALASLHETYTDSEGEIESDAEEETSRDKFVSPSKESSPSSMVLERNLPVEAKRNFFFGYDTSKDKPPQSKLVSYATEGIDDEEMSDLEDSKSLSDDTSESTGFVIKKIRISPVEFHRNLLNLKKHEVELPPEPAGRCSKSVQEKISQLYEKKKQGKDMNASIQKRKDFRNPSIYEKLIQFCGIDEQGTNYPPETYDPHCWGAESFYEELAKRQKEEMDKREKEKKERTKVEFISGTAKKTTEAAVESNKRKSKWDIGINQMPATALKPATLITPTVLPVATGTKPTVISAFGTITKKAKP